MKVVIEQSDSTIEIMEEKEFQEMVDSLDKFDGIHPYIFLGYLCDKKQVKVEPEVSDDLVREVETKFINAMLGKSEVPLEYPMTYYTAPLVAAYRQGQTMKLPENLILKHCCVVLVKIINDNQTEKIRQALNSR